MNCTAPPPNTMSFFTTLNPPIVGPGLTPARAKGSQFRSSSVLAIAKHSAQPTTTHQWKVMEGSLDLEDTFAVSRRKMMVLTGLSLAVFSLASPDPAEARMTRVEMKNRILKKLRELREKVGISNPTDENEEQTIKPEKDSVPQQEFSNEQKLSTSQEDERREAMPSPEGVDGKDSSLQTKNERREESTAQDDKSPLLPFLNLTEVELDPLAEANVLR